MRSKLISSAKEKGFELKPHTISIDKNYFLWLCLFQQWFRDYHKLEVSIIPRYNPSGYTIMINNPKNKNNPDQKVIGDIFSSYEEALEKGLEIGLSII